MSKSEPLLELIYSLSQSEKRYFKLYAGAVSQKDDSFYLQLFDQIDGSELHELSQIDIPDDYAKNLSFHKNYLYNQILKALRSYHSQKDHFIKLQDAVTDIHILSQKNLARQALKRLRAAKKIAEPYSYDTVLLRLQMMERSLIRGFGEKNTLQSLEAVHAEAQTCLNQLKNRLQVGCLYDKAFLLSRNNTVNKKKREQVIAEILDDQESLAELEFSTEGKIIYHQLFATFYQYLEKEPELVEFHIEALIDHFESTEGLIRQQTQRYLNLLNNYLNYHYHKDNFEPFAKTIAKLKSLKPASGILKTKLFYTTFHLELLMLLRTGQFEEARKIIPAFERDLPQHAPKIPRVNFVTIVINIAAVYFHLSHYNKSLEWIRNILDDARSEVRPDVTLYAKILELIIHFESGAHRLIEPKARSILRAIRNQDKQLAHVCFGETAAKFIRKINRWHPNNTQPLFIEFRNALQDIPTAAGIEDVSLWVSRKIKS